MEQKTLQQKLGKYYIALKILVIVSLILVLRFLILENSLDFITLNSLASSIISGAIFVVGFLLAGVFADYKEVDKLPSEIRSILESILSEGDTLLRKDQTFKTHNENLKKIVIKFIHEFESGLSHAYDHSHL